MAALEHALPLAQLAQRIELETGLHFGAAGRRDLGAALARMAHESGAASPQALAAWLLDGPWDAARDRLCARYLTIGETYFFREPRGFDLLVDYARRKLGADPAHATLRLWSAGCCTGEEPYSMAIALREALPRLDPARVSILGTDLNEASLAFARAGAYREWSFRRTSSARRAAWFAPDGAGRWQLAPEVRAQVRFARLNLATPCYPAAASATQALDVIFCRNVLMYFSRRQMKLAIERLRACLVDGGWLVVNPSEASAELFAGFTGTYHPDAIFFQKTAGGAARPAPQPAAPPVRRRVQPPLAAPRMASAPRPPAPVPVVASAAVPAQPAGAEAALAQARALAEGGSHEAARQLLARAANQWPLAAPLHQAAAQLALDQGDFPAARRHLQRQLYLEPDSIMAHYLNAVAHMGEGRHAAARRQFGTSAMLLDALADGATVPGADGWQAASLRASVRAWLERSA